MSSPESKPIDKAAWGPGPWQDEPDRWEGEHEGFPLLAVRNRMGAWCGYAAMPPGHPWHGAHGCAQYPDADVHGGLTYGEACQGNICHVPKAGEPDNVWWLGFDCNHSGDIAPGMIAMEKKHGWPPLLEHYAQYRTLKYVQRECRNLAEQAKAARKE